MGDLGRVFEARLERICRTSGSIVAILDDYISPLYVQRIWCIYETFKATTLGLKIEVALPEHVQTRLFAHIQDGNFSGIANSIQQIDAGSARAASKDDEDKIKDTICKGVGYDVLNTVVKSCLRESISNVFCNYLESLESAREKAEMLTPSHVSGSL